MTTLVPPPPSVELDCTENNSVYTNPGKQTTSLVNGLFLADSICAAMNTEFNSVVWWDLRNGQETTNNNSSSLYGWRQYGDYGVTDSVDPAGPADTYPTFYVDRLLQHFARGGDQLVSSASDYPLVSVCAAERNQRRIDAAGREQEPEQCIQHQHHCQRRVAGQYRHSVFLRHPTGQCGADRRRFSRHRHQPYNRAIDKFFVQLSGLLGQRDSIWRRRIAFANTYYY